MLAGEISRERAVELATRDSRHYAKRQMTWIRNNFNSNLTVSEKFSESLYQRIFAILSK
jgi:tRNA dimethylallyltransferase